MITRILIVAFIAICFVSCEKEPIATENQIEGTWIWVKTVGGIGGWEYTPESAMYTKKLIIDETYYREFIDDSLTVEFEYVLGTTQESQIGTTDSTYIEFDGGSRWAYHLDDDELEFHQQAIDGFSSYYEKE